MMMKDSKWKEQGGPIPPSARILSLKQFLKQGQFFNAHRRKMSLCLVGLRRIYWTIVLFSGQKILQDAPFSWLHWGTSGLGRASSVGLNERVCTMRMANCSA